MKQLSYENNLQSVINLGFSKEDFDSVIDDLKKMNNRQFEDFVLQFTNGIKLEVLIHFALKFVLSNKSIHSTAHKCYYSPENITVRKALCHDFLTRSGEPGSSELGLASLE